MSTTTESAESSAERRRLRLHSTKSPSAKEERRSVWPESGSDFVQTGLSEGEWGIPLVQTRSYEAEAGSVSV